MPIVQFKTTQEEEEMIKKLKPFFKTSTRSKVFKKSLCKSYEIYKDMKP